MTTVYHQTFEDFEESIAQLGFSSVNIMQMSAGCFEAYLDLIQLEQLVISRREYTASTIFQGQYGDGRLRFLFGYDSEVSVINGQRQQSDLYVLPDSVDFKFLSPSNMKHISIHTDTEKFSRYLDDSAKRIAASEDLLYYFNVVESIEQRQRKNKIIDMSRATLAASSLSIQAKADAEEALLLEMSELFYCQSSTWQQPSKASRYSIVKRSLEVLHNSIEVGISVAQLAEVSNVSVRALEYAFKKSLGVSPKQYLIYRRFAIIRRYVKSGTPVNTKTLQHKYGVINLSRFRLQYHEWFGEPFDIP